MKPLEEYKQATAEQYLELPDLNPEFPKIYTKICCPNCDSDIPSDNLNINDKIGKCGTCHIVFPFHEEIKGLLTTPQKIKQEILRPEGIEMFYYKDELDISFKQPDSWVEWTLYSIISLFPLVIAASFSKVGFHFIQPVLLISILLSALYFIRRSRHKVYLTINDRSLNVRRRPKKLYQDKSYAVQDIHQLYLKHVADLGTWNVMMIIDKGQGQKHVKLTSVNSISKAKFLEQEIEQHLGIQDVEVPGET